MNKTKRSSYVHPSPVDPARPLLSRDLCERGGPNQDFSSQRPNRSGQLRDRMGEQIWGPTLSNILPATVEGRPIPTPLAGGAEVQKLNPMFRITALHSLPDASGSHSGMVVELANPIDRSRGGQPWQDAVRAPRPLIMSSLTHDGFVEDWAVGASHIRPGDVPGVLVSSEFTRFSTSFVSARAVRESFKLPDASARGGNIKTRL